MIFGNYFFKRKVQKLIADSHGRKHKFCSLEDARSLLVLFRNEDKAAVEPLLEKLRASGKRISCCVSYTGTKDHDDPSVLYVNKNKEADKYGIPNADISARLAKIEADVLIDLSRGKCHALSVLMLQHPSRFKVGERLMDETIYDFSIIMTDGGGTAELFGYILFYLQTIRSK